MYKKAVLFSAQGVQDEEFIYPYYRLQEADMDLTVVFVSTPKYNKAEGKYGIPFKYDVDINELATDKLEDLVSNNDIFIIPGGWQAPEIMRMNNKLLWTVNTAYNRGKIIGAICHGPQVLISANVGKGRNMTAFEGIWDDLRNFGAIGPETGEVCNDNGLITARHYKNNPAFMSSVLYEYFNKYVPNHYQS